MKRLRHILEYLLLRLLLLVVDALPLSWCLHLAHGLGDLAFLLLARRRRIAIDNILQAGIAADPRAARALTRAVFRQFVHVVLTAAKSDTWFRHHPWQECIEWQIPPEVAALLDDERQGLILACGHLGNWELGALLLSHRKPVVGITRRMNNPYVDRLMQSRKPRHRFELTPKRDADIGRLVTALREGKVLAMMIDQNAKQRGMRVDFFGRPASSHTAIALLHLVTRTPICFGTCTEVAPMRFRFRATGPFRFAPTGNKDADVRHILEHLNRELEQAVRDCPEQYLWGHRRWRLEDSPHGAADVRRP